MGLRGQRAVSDSSVQAVRFLVTLMGGSSIAFPSQWVRGIVLPASAVPGGGVTWAGMDYQRIELAARLRVPSTGPSPDTRLILYGNEERSRSFAVDNVLGLVDVGREMIHPLPPHFRENERERFLGFFVNRSSVALIANPFWVLELPLRPHALEMLAVRVVEGKSGEIDPGLHPPESAMEGAMSMFTGHVS